MLYIHPTTLSTLHHHAISYKKKQRNLTTSAILYCYTGEIPGWKIPATWSLALQKQTRTIHMRKIWQQTKCTPVASKALNHTASSSEMKTTFWAFLMSFRAVTISFLPGNTATLQKKRGLPISYWFTFEYQAKKQTRHQNYTSYWWFYQPLWKILVKMGIFPK